MALLPYQNATQSFKILIKGPLSREVSPDAPYMERAWSTFGSWFGTWSPLRRGSLSADRLWENRLPGAHPRPPSSANQ